MLVLLIVNAIGLLCGFGKLYSFMYIIFGVTWTAFFYRYRKLTWKLYERMVETESISTIVDVQFVNSVALVLVMVMIYDMIYLKTGGVCVIASAVQCFVFQVIDTFTMYCNKNLILLIGFMAELILAVVCIS